MTAKKIFTIAWKTIGLLAIIAIFYSGFGAVLALVFMDNPGAVATIVFWVYTAIFVLIFVRIYTSVIQRQIARWKVEEQQTNQT